MSGKDSDESFLHRMGYTQELYRGLSPWMAFTFCFTAVNVLASISIGLSYILSFGGSSVAIWAWIIGSFFTILIGLSLAEICSVYPSAGSVYHWSAQLAPPRYAPLASFICGYFNFFGNVAGVASFSSGFATLLNAALVLNGKSSLSIGEQVAISIAVSFTWTALNILRIDRQGWLNTVAAFLQIVSTIVIAVILLIKSPRRATAKDVFTSTYNNSGFSFGYISCLGILSALPTFSGYEGGAHLAEETRGASRAAPKSIVGACVCSAIIGAIYLLALLFIIPDVTVFMETNSGNNQPINLTVAAFQLVLSRQGVLAFTILLILDINFAGMSSMTVSSRIGFAMARDGIFPFSKHLRWIFEPTQIPLANVLFVFIINSLIILLQLASTVTFAYIIAISTVGTQISYLMPIFFRCTTARRSFSLGQFNLGKFSFPIAIVSCVWLSITSIFMFFPFEYPVTASNMNYAVVIIAGVALIAGIFWFLSARHWYVGPDQVRFVDNDTTADNTPPRSIISLNSHVSDENTLQIQMADLGDTTVTRF